MEKGRDGWTVAELISSYLSSEQRANEEFQT